MFFTPIISRFFIYDAKKVKEVLPTITDSLFDRLFAPRGARGRWSTTNKGAEAVISAQMKTRSMLCA